MARQADRLKPAGQRAMNDKMIVPVDENANHYPPAQEPFRSRI